MNHRWFSLCSLACLLSLVLHADLEDHLKQVGQKSEEHRIRNIDYIYMINLDQRPEKWQSATEQLAPFGIFPHRFSAVNGWELSVEAINDVGVKFTVGMEGDFWGTSYLMDGDSALYIDRDYTRHDELIQHYGQTYFCHCMARGTIGIALSHISLLQDAYTSNYETIWIMEDDIEVRRDPRILSALIDKLDEQVGKSGWDVLFTDRDIRDSNGAYVSTHYAAKRPDFISKNNLAIKEEISAEFRKIGARYGAHSMILRRSGLKKLLEFFKAYQIFLPYDMDYVLPNGLRLYTVNEDVVANLPKALSDNGLPYYLRKSSMQK